MSTQSRQCMIKQESFPKISINICFLGLLREFRRESKKRVRLRHRKRAIDVRVIEVLLYKGLGDTLFTLRIRTERLEQTLQTLIRYHRTLHLIFILFATSFDILDTPIETKMDSKLLFCRMKSLSETETSIIVLVCFLFSQGQP